MKKVKNKVEKIFSYNLLIINSKKYYLGMKRLFFVFCLLLNISFLSISQEADTLNVNDMSLFYEGLATLDNYIDSIKKNTVYIDHSRYRGKIIQMILSKKNDELLKIINSKGFNGFNEMNCVLHSLKLMNSDSLALDLFSKIKADFPKNKSYKPDEFTNDEFLTVTSIGEHWTFINKSNLKCEFSVYFHNGQLTNIGYRISENK